MANDILIVDDELDIRRLTGGILEDEGYVTREAHDSTSAIASVNARRPGLVLLDIWLQGSDLDGLGILKEIKRGHPEIPVLMMSGHGTVETAVSAIKEGAYDFIEKPFKSDRLLLLVNRAMEAARLRRENRELRQKAAPEMDLIGRSSAIREVHQVIERVAASNSRVLISGPSGSGKEVVARLIHQRSRRADGPFVVVNCASITPDRMEVELFGTEGVEGERRVGTFEQAHGGTLLLDEVADMPIETQGKIVRVLQDQVFERVGGASRVEVDVRVIASTTRDLQSEIDAGQFREDLYYRLNVVPISVPSLRQRREDINELVEHFIARTAEVLGHPRRALGDAAVAALQAYEWPGNVRELRNVVERVLILTPSGGDHIGPDMLPREIYGTAPTDEGGAGAGNAYLGMPLKDAREGFEREYLQFQINRFGGNISKTAQFVGMERSALHRKLKSLGLTGDDRSNA